MLDTAWLGLVKADSSGFSLPQMIRWTLQIATSAWRDLAPQCSIQWLLPGVCVLATHGARPAKLYKKPCGKVGLLSLLTSNVVYLLE